MRSRRLNRGVSRGRFRKDLGPFGEVHQPGCSRAELAGVDVERFEFVFVVDVQPLAAGVSSCFLRHFDELSSDALTMKVSTNFGVDEEGVIASVPRDVDEADRLTVRESCCHPAEAERANGIPPPRARRAAMRLRERDELFVADLTTPDVLDPARHRYMLALR